MNNQENIVTDIDGNVYHTVTIGKQVWMVENLKTTKYNNGDPLPIATDDKEWETQTTGAYCKYDNPDYENSYGNLYNWFAVNDSRKIAPKGWHIPTDAEWETLINFLDGEGAAGGKLKESGTKHWKSPNTAATNESGFTALPGGTRDVDGPFNHLGYMGYYWSATESSNEYAWYRCLDCDGSFVLRLEYFKKYGFSLRCIKD